MKNHSIKTLERDGCGEQLKVFRDRITKLQQSASQTPLEVLNSALEELRNAAEELSVMHEDLLEQNEAILAARQVAEAEHARYRDLFNFAPLAYITTDIWGKIQEANIAASRLLNVPQKFLLDKTLTAFIDVDAHGTFSSHLVAAAEGKAIVEWEVPVGPRNRQLRRTSITIAPVNVPGAKINSLRWLIRDITEQKRVEKQLRQNAVLTALGTGVAKIAHGIANPLSGMFLSVQMLLERLSQQEKPEGGTLRIAVELKQEMKQLQVLLQELREFSRPWQPDLKPVNVSQMIAEITSAAHLESCSSPILCEQHVAEGLPPLIADEDKLKEALLNLITNAVEAMPKGGRITVRGYREDQHVCLEIEDTGCGIPPGMNIFEPFVTSKGDGWGLGLAIVRGAIAAHNGTIDYTSTPGRGTRFKICLPLRAVFDMVNQIPTSEARAKHA